MLSTDRDSPSRKLDAYLNMPAYRGVKNTTKMQIMDFWWDMPVLQNDHRDLNIHMGEIHHQRWRPPSLPSLFTVSIVPNHFVLKIQDELLPSLRSVRLPLLFLTAQKCDFSISLLNLNCVWPESAGFSLYQTALSLERSWKRKGQWKSLIIDDFGRILGPDKGVERGIGLEGD